MSTCTPPPWPGGWPRPGGGRTGLRHRGRPRPVGPARALEDRRRPRRGDGAPLQAGGRDRAECRRRGEFSTYQARAVAARDTRKAKRHERRRRSDAQWRAELEEAGFAPGQLDADVAGPVDVPAPPPRVAADASGAVRAGRRRAGSRRGPRPAARSSPAAMWSWPLGPAPYGQHPAELDQCGRPGPGDPEAVPLVGCAGATGAAPTRPPPCWPRRPPSPRAWPASWAATTPPSVTKVRRARHASGRTLERPLGASA